MKTIKMLVELKIDEDMFGNTKGEKDWFFKDILKSKRKNDLILHSNEIGDEVGSMKVLAILD